MTTLTVVGALIAVQGRRHNAMAANRPSNGATSSLAATPLTDRADSARVRGSSAAPLWVVEIGDFQCSVCKEWNDVDFAPFDKEFVQTGKVRFAFINFPLTQHLRARPAAEAAMCAGAQGKFWAMHDSLYATQNEWTTADNPRTVFRRLAGRISINTADWDDCVGHGLIGALIDVDRDRARTAGVGATPTFFVGTERIDGLPARGQLRVAVLRQLR